MKTSIAGGVIHTTDYFSSRDRDEGRAWLVMHGTGWHVLLPQPCPRRPTVAHARPLSGFSVCQHRAVHHTS
jgi:hypothetical protein